MKKIGAWPWNREKQELTPAEVEQMILSRASEASLIRYQTAVCSGVTEQVSNRVEEFAENYNRHIADEDIPVTSRYVDGRVGGVLEQLALIIRGSNFPSEPVFLRHHTGEK